MNEEKAASYAKRFNRVLDYIEQHVSEPLSLEQLCQVAHFSKFHFHRQFADYLGIPVARYILLLRLKQASYRLVFEPRTKVIEAALDAGFENPESFARAFRHVFGKSPSAFRKGPDWEAWHGAFRFRLPKRSQMVNVQIVDFPDTPIGVKEHWGPVAKLNYAVGQFIEWRKTSGLSPKDSCRTFGIAYENPETVEPERFHFDVGGEVHGPIPPNPQGVIGKLIPGGRCAVVRHLGSHDRIGDSIYPLYRDWLPGSGEELRDFPLFFHYLNLIPETPEGELVTDIYLPLV